MRPVTQLAAAVLSCLAAIVPPVVAHHSIAGAYDTRREVTIEATVDRFRFVNPHPMLSVRVETEVWQLEMDNRRELTREGMTEDSFKPGDRIVVAGNPSRSEARRLYIRRLDRPSDGFVYEQVGTRPRITRTGR